MDASLYYLAVMLEGGEDPRFIARRMIVLASEDIGNADPQALVVAVAASQAVEHVGMPECALNLSQAAAYLALAPKSNASTKAIARARADVQREGAADPPSYLQDAHYFGAKKLGRGVGYEYPHNVPGGVSDQSLLPEGMEDRRYYEPTDRGFEEQLRKRIADCAPKAAQKRANSHYALIQPMRSICSKQGSATLSSARRALRLGFAALAAMVVVSSARPRRWPRPARSTWAAMARWPTRLRRVR